MNHIKPFVIRETNNSSYIDTLLVAIFYKQSYFDKFLNSKSNNVMVIYLQQYVNRMVEMIRKNKSIADTKINYLRYLLFENGWKDKQSYYRRHNIGEFYAFLANILKSDPIIFSNGHENQIVDLSHYIDSDTRIKELLDTKFKSIYINNLSYILPLYLGQHTYKVDIMETIAPFKNSDTMVFNDCRWTFHSLVCKDGKDGHYYCLIKVSDIWYIFNDHRIPCIYEVDLKEVELTDTIKRESYLVFYTWVQDYIM